MPTAPKMHLIRPPTFTFVSTITVPTAPKMRLSHILYDKKKKPTVITRWVIRYFHPEHDHKAGRYILKGQKQQLNPCCQDGLMTMWCCKPPSFYRTIKVGSLMIAFASASEKKKKPSGRVMFVCQWTDKIPVVQYLNDPRYRHRFDCMYDTTTTPWTRNENGGPHHRGDHMDTRRGKGKMTDCDLDQTREWVLMSTNFRDYHSNPRPMPAHLRHIVHKGIGCCKTNTVADECAVRAYFGL